VATALAALRDEAGHAAGASATEAVLPRELPAADPMPLADEASEPEVVAAAPEPVVVEQPEVEPEVAQGPEPAAEPGVPAEPEPAAVETPETEPEVVGDAPEPVAIERPEPERELVVEPEPEPDVEAVEPGPVAIVEPEPEPEPEVAASEPEPEPEPEVAASGPEPVVVEQPEVVAAEPEPVVVEPEPVVVEQPEPATEPESVAGEPDRVTVEPVAEVPSGLDVTLIEEPEAEPTPPPAATADVPAVPAAEASPGLEPDDQPAPEAVAVSPEPEREADAVETEMAEQPIGDELEAEEVDVDLEPIGAPSVDGMPKPALDENVAADAASVTDQPDAAEPIRWDRERYTVDIVEPDWYAGEEPQPADPAVRDEARPPTMTRRGLPTTTRPSLRPPMPMRTRSNLARLPRRRSPSRHHRPPDMTRRRCCGSGASQRRLRRTSRRTRRPPSTRERTTAPARWRSPAPAAERQCPDRRSSTRPSPLSTPSAAIEGSLRRMRPTSRSRRWSQRPGRERTPRDGRRRHLRRSRTPRPPSQPPHHGRTAGCAGSFQADLEAASGDILHTTSGFQPWAHVASMRTWRVCSAPVAPHATKGERASVPSGLVSPYATHAVSAPSPSPLVSPRATRARGDPPPRLLHPRRLKANEPPFLRDWCHPMQPTPCEPRLLRR